MQLSDKQAFKYKKHWQNSHLPTAFNLGIVVQFSESVADLGLRVKNSYQKAKYCVYISWNKPALYWN
jgi:hypothetical protein